MEMFLRFVAISALLIGISAPVYAQWVSGGGGGSGTPGGTVGQAQYNNSGSFGGFTVGGDGTLDTSTGALTVSTSNGVAIAPVLSQVTTGTSNTIASLTSSFTTSVWISATSGAKTQNIPGCAVGVGNFRLFVLDGQKTAGTDNITITPSSGTIGLDAAASLAITSNGGAVGLQCDSTSSNWRVIASSLPGTNVRYASSTSLTVGATDNGGVIQQSNGAAVAATIAQAGTAGFPLGRYSTIIQNVGAGLVTLTPTTSTINGAATATIAQNASLMVFADLVGNYIGINLPPGISYGTGVATALGVNLSAAGGLTTTVASGTSALGTGAISSAACASVVTTAATNTATTDVVLASFNGDPTGVTGYIPATTGMLTIISYPTSGNVNFKVCNNTSSSITPGAITLNWRVVR
jgi:hypothetical protein